MNIYKNNIKWIVRFSPFTLLPFSGAFVTPFLLHNQLSQTEIFLLQSVYSVVYLAWNIPSGYLSDRFGHALSIKIGAPIAAAAMIFYGSSDHFWQFVLCEAALAIGEGLFQGADSALLIESLNKEKREKDYVRLSQRMSALGWAGAALGVPLSMFLVSQIGLGATLVADGCLILVGALIALKLRELPREFVSEEEQNITATKSLKTLLGNIEVRWLLVLTITLSAAPFLAFWVAAPYYTSLGIPVVLFGLIFAIRSAWKAWLAHKFHKDKNIQRSSKYFAGLVALSYAGMATQQLWLVWLVLGHDAVEALQSQPIIKEINRHITSRYRATLNSAIDMARRLVFTVLGPLIGLVIDKGNLRLGLISAGIFCSGLSFFAISKLSKLKVF